MWMDKRDAYLIDIIGFGGSIQSLLKPRLDLFRTHVSSTHSIFFYSLFLKKNLVKTFFSILQSISLSDTKIIENVCDDTLGGIPSIDSKSFAVEYIRQRTIDVEKISKGQATSVPLQQALSKKSTPSDDASFTVVSKKRGSKKRLSTTHTE